MVSIRRNVVMFDATPAATGDWIRLDSRYDNDAVRAIQGTVTAGDTISLEATTVDIRGEEDPTATITAADIVNLIDYTADFADTLTGNWTYIRIVKTGSTGPSKVQGNL